MDKTADTTIKARYRGDRRKHPQVNTYRYMTYDELLRFPQYGRIFAHSETEPGIVSQLKITSIRTWKTRPEIEIRWQFGLWDFGCETVYPDQPQTVFVTRVD